MIGMIIPLLIAIFGSVSMVQNFQRKKMVAYKKQMKEEESAEQYITSANIPLSPLVENYRGQVLEAARKYGIEEYTDLMLAVMMQESGGACVDVFQCSESLGKPPNSIDTATSIDRACQIMSGYLMESGVGGIMDIIHIKLALQSYNFGGGFLKFVKENGGEWTQELTNEFARQKSNGVRNTGVRAERLGEWRYGDQHYTDHVLRYYPYMPSGDSAEISGIPLENRMSWLFPNGEPTSSTQMQEYLTTVSIPVIDTAGTESTAQLTVHKSIAGGTRKPDCIEETQSVLDIPEIVERKEKVQEEAEPQEVPKKPKKTEYSTDFQRFWGIYPRKDGKGEAYKKYKARLNDGCGTSAPAKGRQYRTNRNGICL